MATPTERHQWENAGMAAVAVAAAVGSFTALAGLAVLAGWRGSIPLWAVDFRVAWLVPVSVDAYAAVATSVWLRAPAGPIRDYARRNAVGAIGSSIAGNAAFHALTAAGVTNLMDEPFGWLVLVVVSSTSAVMLGLVVHLRVLQRGLRVPEPPAAVDVAALVRDALPDVAGMVAAAVQPVVEQVGSDMGRLRAEVADVREQVARNPEPVPRFKVVPPQLSAGQSRKDQAKAAARQFYADNGEWPGRKKLATLAGLSEGTCQDALRELRGDSDEKETA